MYTSVKVLNAATIAFAFAVPLCTMYIVRTAQSMHIQYYSIQYITFIIIGAGKKRAGFDPQFDVSW